MLKTMVPFYPGHPDRTKLEAVIGLVTEFDIKADVLVSIALIA